MATLNVAARVMESCRREDCSSARKAGSSPGAGAGGSRSGGSQARPRGDARATRNRARTTLDSLFIPPRVEQKQEGPDEERDGRVHAQQDEDGGHEQVRVRGEQCVEERAAQ